MALTDKLSAIGVAIRAKTGGTALLTLDQMPTEIANISGGGNEPTDEELVVTGNCSYRFANGGWDWFIEKYGNRITTKDITNATEMFNVTKVTEIPFDINITNCQYLPRMMGSASYLNTCPKIRGTIKWDEYTELSNVLDASGLRDIEQLFLPEMLDGFSTVKVTGAYKTPEPFTFGNLCSLRQVPSWFYKFRLNPESTAFPYYGSCVYYYLFYYCYNLDEVTNIPVWYCTAAQTKNMFNYAFKNTSRLKNITFETQEDGSPIEVQWSDQTINLVDIGYAQSDSSITHFNSGITLDKRVKDDATYQALKDDPDWYTLSHKYCRYNHDSAVATINSLPDTSAYLATAGGTNTIQFYGKSGESTDGGAINTLTEEEIAVATAKGWTVTLK